MKSREQEKPAEQDSIERSGEELTDQELERASGGAQSVHLWLKSNGTDGSGFKQVDERSSRWLRVSQESSGKD